MNLDEAKPGTRVIYVPEGEGLDHPDCLPGTIVRVERGYVFVKFDLCVKRVGERRATPMGNRPEWLVEE